MKKTSESKSGEENGGGKEGKKAESAEERKGTPLEKRRSKENVVPVSNNSNNNANNATNNATNNANNAAVAAQAERREENEGFGGIGEADL